MITFIAPDAESMRRFGQTLAQKLTAGDLVLLTGGLGAGKTTLTQGLGAGLGVTGLVTSPTFVLSRIHDVEGEGPGLVHVDAYRLGSAAEVDDLDLDESMATSVTVIEWGEGLAEGLSEDRLEIVIDRSSDPDDETRTLTVNPRGPRWQNTSWEDLR